MQRNKVGRLFLVNHGFTPEAEGLPGSARYVMMDRTDS